MDQINLLLGGPTKNLPPLDAVVGPWIGVDHGNITLLQQHITPMISVGDFDSLTTVERAMMEAQVADIRYANPIKDWTDSQLALQVALDDCRAQHLTLYGATGARLDHELVNLFLPLDLHNPADMAKLQLVDRQNVIDFYPPGHYQIKRLPQMKYLAFFNLTPVQQLTIQKAKYQLAATDFTRPTSLASNEFVGPTVNFSFTQGVVAVIQSCD